METSKKIFLCLDDSGTGACYSVGNTIRDSRGYFHRSFLTIYDSSYYQTIQQKVDHDAGVHQTLFSCVYNNKQKNLKIKKKL